MTRTAINGAVPILLALAASGASAHHSFLGRFDRRAMMELEGEVTELLWRNPHTYFTVRVVAADGTATDWEIETSSLSVLRRQGVANGTIEIGDRVRLAGYPPVGEQHEMYVRHVLLPDGRELLMDMGLEPRWSEQPLGRESVLAVRDGDPSRPDLGIFRVWSFVRNGPRLFPEVVDPNFDPRSYPLTERARAALADYDIVAQNPTANCEPKGMPTIMEQPYPIEFVRRDEGRIVLRIEEYDLERTIYMEPSTVPANAPLSFLGISTGEWDGDALVVTTTRVDWPWFSQIGIPQSDAVEIVERFAPTENGSRLNYTVTVTDPETFTRPVTLSTYWIWVPGVELLPYRCAERRQAPQ